MRDLDIPETMSSYISDAHRHMDVPLKTATQESAEVFYSSFPDVCLSQKEVTELCDKAKQVPRGRLRFCLHTEIENPLHEMVIVHPYRAYVPPHKHHGQSESIIILEGILDLVIFNDDGIVAHVVPMGSIGSGRIFHHRLGIPQFHTMLIHSSQVVFTEIKTGPYEPEKTEVAVWAPTANDSKAIGIFLSELFSKYKTTGN